MTVGIIFTNYGNKVPIEILPADSRRLVIDSQIVSMRYAGANNIFVVVHPEHAALYTTLFADQTYEQLGIIPRIISTRLHGWPKTTWALGELSEDQQRVFLGYGSAIVPPSTHERLFYADPSAGLKIARIPNKETPVAQLLSPAAARMLRFSAKEQVLAMNEVIRVLGKIYIECDGIYLDRFEDYVRFIKSNE